MKDVAQSAGVSITTVSHTLNSTRFVEDETREKVFKAIKELGYKPNILAQSLKGKGTKTIGIIISDIRENYFSEIVKSIETIANDNGYNIMLCDSEDDSTKEDLYINILLQKGIDALIFAPVDQEKEFMWLEQADIPCVQIDRKSKCLSGDYIGIENEESSRRATEILITNGCRRIGFIGYGDEVFTMAGRFHGYEQAIQKQGLEPFVHRTVHRGESTQKIGEWLAREELDGVLCTNENLSYFAFLAAVNRGKIIPEEMKIIGYDDAKWLNLLKSPLTVIRQPTEDIGKTAVETVIESIEKKNAHKERTTILPCEIVVRESCGSREQKIISISGRRI